MIAWGVELCLRFDACFLVFHAIPPPHGSVARQIEFARGGEKKEKVQKARGKIKALMEKFDVTWDAVITYGDPVIEVATVAKKTNTDMVIAASLGLSNLQQFFMGSVIRCMAQKLMHPLLVIPPGKPTADKTCLKLELTHIVIACSLKASDACLKRYALAIAEKFNSTLCLVHVMESPMNESVMVSTSGHYNETQRLLEKKISLRLKRLLSVKTQLLHGVPGEELAVYANRHGINLIIAGGNDQPGRIITTTTATLLRHLPCAVLTVPVTV